MFATLSRTTTPRTMGMSPSWKDRRTQQIVCGENLQELQKEERAKGGVLDMETEVVSGITAYGPAYIDESMKDLEQVVGLQTDKPLKRAFMPYGGIKMAEKSCENVRLQTQPEASRDLHQVSQNSQCRLYLISTHRK